MNTADDTNTQKDTITDIATYRLNWPRGRFNENAHPCRLKFATVQPMVVGQLSKSKESYLKYTQNGISINPFW